ncbi:MAG: exosortase F system-associated protein [Flavobacteriaceae bacterium]|nr:exosortase F system-associated protein [Flavobacteriaceae bacterium]
MLAVLVIGLILVRMFENEFFYDPLLSYFKSNYSNNPFPEINSFKLVGNIAFRFLLNTIISLGILWIVFKDKEILKLAFFLFGILFCVLMIAFSYLLFYSNSDSFLPLFYVRRFLIQPILLLVLLPAFYFQKKRY